MNANRKFETTWMERYQHLLAIDQAPARTDIIERCKISKDVFYNYLYGRTEVPVLVKEVLEEVFSRYEEAKFRRISAESESKQGCPNME